MQKDIKRYNSDSDETEQYANITAMQSLNESLRLTGESPIKKKKDQVKVSTLHTRLKFKMMWKEKFLICVKMLIQV
jgi:hypothetical protein